MIVFAVIAVIAIVVAVWAIATRNKAVPASDIAIPQQAFQTPAPPTPTVEPLTNQIAFPQFAWIYFAADQTQQSRTFENPPQNFAQFRVTLALDGETLWESDLLKPGETSAPVVLSRPLAAGEYTANLIYTCYTNDEAMNSLNGANSPITLRVQ